MSIYKTTGFKKLQQEWYNKLEESGFVDVEATHNEHQSFRDFEAKHTYYARSTAYLANTQFETILEKTIWFLHSEGYSIRETSKVVRLSRPKISEIVAKHLAASKVMDEPND